MRRNKKIALEEAKLYSTKKEMEIKANSLYQYLYRNKMLDIACKHMVSGKRKYTDEELMYDAKKYKTRYEWQKSSRNMYNASKHIGLKFLDKCCEHMEQLKHKWTEEEILKIACNYSSRKEFEIIEPNCYAAARRKGILKKATNHMKLNSNTFNANAKTILYYISINNGMYYKIGVTNFSVERRFEKEYSLDIKIIFEKKYSTGYEALEKESEIINKYKKYKTEDNVLKYGNTEVFTFDILGLDIQS